MVLFLKDNTLDLGLGCERCKTYRAPAAKMQVEAPAKASELHLGAKGGGKNITLCFLPLLLPGMYLTKAGHHRSWIRKPPSYL